MRNATTDLLDALREAKGIESDYALSKLLAVRQTTISNYRRGRSQLSDEMALKVAKLLGRPAPSILALLASERAKDPEVAKVWREMARLASQLGRSRSLK